MFIFFKKIFEKILDLDKYTKDYVRQSKIPQLPSYAYFNWGRYLKNEGMQLESFQLLESASQMFHPHPEAFLELAINAYYLNDKETALEHIRQVLNHDSYNGLAYALMATINADSGDYATAEKLFKKANKLSPFNVKILMNWGIMLAKQGQRAEAKKKFYNALMCDNDNLQIMQLLGTVLVEMGNHLEALECFKRLISLDNANFVAHYWISIVYMFLKDYEKSCVHAQQAISLNKFYIEPYITLALCYDILNQDEKAEQVYKEALSLGINSEKLFYNYAVTLTAHFEYEKANFYYDMLLDVDANNSDVLLKKSLNCFQLKHFDEAENLLQRYISLNQSCYYGYYYLAQVYAGKKEYEKAIEHYHFAMKSKRKTEFLHEFIGDCYVELENFGKAADSYIKAMDNDSKNAMVAMKYAKVMLKMDSFQEALRKIRKAYLIERQNVEIIFLYGCISCFCGDFNNGLEKFETALTLDRTHLKSQVGKACVLLLKNDNASLEFLLNNQLFEDESLRLFLNVAQHYSELALKTPSDYNINEVIKLCDKISELNPENELIKQKRIELGNLST